MSQKRTKDKEDKTLKIEAPSEAEIAKALKPVTVKTEGEPKKRGRGRPRKKVAPTYNQKKYAENPMAKLANTALTEFMNKSVLRNSEKMKPEDSEVGEAVIYIFDYYGKGLMEHPLAILLFAIGGFGATVYEKKQKVITKEIKHKGIKDV